MKLLEAIKKISETLDLGWKRIGVKIPLQKYNKNKKVTREIIIKRKED